MRVDRSELPADVPLLATLQVMVSFGRSIFGTTRKKTSTRPTTARPYDPRPNLSRRLSLHRWNGIKGKTGPRRVGTKFNRGEDFVVVDPISSRPDSSDKFSVTIADHSPNFPATKLKQTSAVKCSKPFTISRRLVQRRLGTLEQPLLAEVVGRLLELFDEPL